MWAFYGRIGNQASYKRTFMQVFIHMDRVNFANIWVVVGGGTIWRIGESIVIYPTVNKKTLYIISYVSIVIWSKFKLISELDVFTKWKTPDYMRMFYPALIG